MNSFRKYAVIILPFFILLLLITPQPAHAIFGVSTTDIVTIVFRAVAFIFNFLGGILFTLAGLLVNLMLGLNLSMLEDSNTLVHVGWQLVRDIANLGFVLVIIIIAFATILRFEQYGVTKLLPKLIAAAIIVNFSFAIAAVFINFTHVLTNFFAERALPEMTLGGLSGWDLSTSLSNAFGPQRFFIESEPLPPSLEDEAGAMTEFGTAALTSITGLVFTVIFTFIAALVLLAFAFLLFLRYLYLTFLVILAPLIWLFWVIPALKGQFNKWWDKFLQWAFFAPATMFFVYLALISVEGIGDVGVKLKGTGGFFTGVLQNVMIQGAQMLVLSGILIGGLIIAQKMSITLADSAVRASKAGTFGLTKWVGRKGLRGATMPLRAGRTPARLRSLRAEGAQRARTGTSMLSRTWGRAQQAVGGELYKLSQQAAGKGPTLWQSTVGATTKGLKKNTH